MEVLLVSMDLSPFSDSNLSYLVSFFFLFIPSCGQSAEALTGAVEYSGGAWEGL